ncbi:hypothetical protein [Desulfospira joergensenii]|uniref:hypothetical protein n=1 Tax=Desulfospira joergensenii TaxID=53329 RepID=UPI0003B44418|nr:hypothetical protein [Desulfospira joergensenii]
MTGISEILVLVFLICLILIVPRMMKPAPKKVSQKPSGKLSPGMRAGIVASILLPFVAALILKPWEGRLAFYVCIGILPVILSWAALWVAAGKKK